MAYDRMGLTNSSWRSNAPSAFAMEPLSLSIDEDILPNLKSFGLAECQSRYAVEQEGYLL